MVTPNDLDRFLRFVAALEGGPGERPELTWSRLAAWAGQNRVVFDAAIHELAQAAAPELDLSEPVSELTVEAPPAGTDYERWSEKKRLRANLNALAALRRMQAQGRVVPEPAERAAMAAYSGWGGFSNIEDLPPDPRLFPPLYVQGIQTWKKAVERREVPLGPGADLFRGLRQQYFTGLDVCTAMWQLACRAAPFRVQEVLEPSAGVGRFLLAGDEEEVHFTAVEMDALLAEFLRALFPDATVYEGAFEQFAVETAKSITKGGGWDLVIGNPPYPKRPPEDRRVDPKWGDWQRADTYFTVRSLSLLRPGGVIAFLTPMSNIIGSSSENRAMRESMLQRAHFLGAVFPPASIFPSVREGRFAVHLWVRRGEDHHVLDDYERDVVLAGKYADTEEGRQNTLGTWKRVSRGKDEDDGDSYITGTFEPTRMVEAALRPISQEDMERIRTARGEVSPGVPVLAPEVAEQEAAVEERSEVLVEATLLADRVSDFSRRVSSGGADAALAEAGRDELRLDVLTFVETFGNPHKVRELKGHRKRLAALLAAIDSEGELSPGLVERQFVGIADAPGPGARPQDVVAFYSRRSGVCTELDLEQHFSRDVSAVLMADPAIAVEFRPDGYRWWYRNEEYATGDLYARLAAVDAALDGVGVDSAAIRTKLEDQKALLLASIDEKVIADVDVTPRSGFVPPECLSDWINDVIYASELPRARTAEKADWKEKKKAQYKSVSDVQRRQIEAYVTDGRLRVRNVGTPALDDVDNDWLGFLLGYWNRSLRTEDPEEKATGRKNLFKTKDVEARMVLEEALVSSFRTWLAENEVWSLRLQNAYNQSYQGFRLRKYDEAPISVARLGPHPKGYQLQAHQNATVRRLLDRRGGIAALDVGLGKTACALASAALWRQEGKARKALVVVPNSVLAKWYKEALEWLPSYRVGLIGITPGSKGRAPTSDGPETRAEKWNKLAQGAYDLAICSHDNFVNDVALSDVRTSEIVGQLFWLQRDLGAGREEMRILERKVEEAEKKIKSKRADIAEKEVEKETKVYESTVRALQSDIDKLKEQIGKLEDDVAKWRDQIGQPTSSEIERAREAASGFVQDRPFRPSNDRRLVDWDALGVDMLIVDEAHAYKNIWKPANRYGKTIKYMGSMEQKVVKRGKKKEEGEDEEEDEGGKGGKRTIRAWDMYLKCLDLLERNDDGGVVLLTATPVKNSPIEVYNLISLVSRRVWERRQVRSKEEFVDRYCKFEEQLTADMTTGSVAYNLAMTEFVALDELRTILSTYVEYRTTQEVLRSQEAMGVPPERRIKVPSDRPVQVNLPLDPVQGQVYQQLREFIVKEQERLREEKASPKEISALTLVLTDLLSKAALDPRLLIEDVENLNANIEDELAVAQKREAWVRGGRRGKEPRAADEQSLKRMERRLAILQDSGVATLSETYRNAGRVPPKYLALAENVRKTASCGHVVFCDYKMAFPDIIDVLVEYGGIDRKRIVTLTGDDDKADRSEIANGDPEKGTGGFNGRDRVVRFEGTPDEVILDPGADPSYDIILGTSGAMSEGIDLQRRTCAVHHLNYTWEPATIQQRNGRGVRQGNQLGEVSVFYYLSERTVDVVRLSVTWGKGNWLESLFGAAQSAANPAAAIGEDLEEAIATMFAADPEEARAKLAEVKAVREAERLHRGRGVAQAKFLSLVNQYAEYRKISDPVTREAKMALTDRAAEQVRALPRTVFPRPDLLDVARARQVFYDIENGVVFYPGSFVCLSPVPGAPGADEAPETARIEVVSFRATPGRQGVTLGFTFRRFGEVGPRHALSLRELAGLPAPVVAKSDKDSETEGVSSSSVGPVVVQGACDWTMQDELAVMKETRLKIQGLREATRPVAKTIGNALWRALVEQAATAQSWSYESRLWDESFGFVPLRSLSEPGQVWLLTRDVAQMALGLGDKETAQSKMLMQEATLLYPSEEDGWRLFCEALRTDRLRVIERAPGRGGAFVLQPIDTEDKAEVTALSKVARSWFDRVQGVPVSMLREMERRRLENQGRAHQAVRSGVAF